MKSSELSDNFRAKEEDVRSVNNSVLEGSRSGKVVVGKHVARNHAHLKQVLAEADETCPRAADTIRWLLWHEIVDAQWYLHMAEMVEDPIDE